MTTEDVTYVATDVLGSDGQRWVLRSPSDGGVPFAFNAVTGFRVYDGALGELAKRFHVQLTTLRSRVPREGEGHAMAPPAVEQPLKQRFWRRLEGEDQAIAPPTIFGRKMCPHGGSSWALLIGGIYVRIAKLKSVDRWSLAVNQMSDGFDFRTPQDAANDAEWRLVRAAEAILKSSASHPVNSEQPTCEGRP